MNSPRGLIFQTELPIRPSGVSLSQLIEKRTLRLEYHPMLGMGSLLAGAPVLSCSLHEKERVPKALPNPMS